MTTADFAGTSSVIPSWKDQRESAVVSHLKTLVMRGRKLMRSGGPYRSLPLQLNPGDPSQAGERATIASRARVNALDTPRKYHFVLIFSNNLIYLFE